MGGQGPENPPQAATDGTGGRASAGVQGSGGATGAAGARPGVHSAGPGAPAANAGPAEVRAAAKAKAAALAAAKAAAARGGARAAAADAGREAPAAPPLSPALQAFAAEVQAAVAGLEPDPLTLGLPAYRVARERLLEVCVALRAAPSPGLDYLTCLTGVDYPEHIDLVYHVYSIARPGLGLVLKAAAPKVPGGASGGGDGGEDLPWLPSVTGVWPGAEWHEREVFDLLGVRFEGHPDLRRILTPEGFSGGYPLRKDYVDRREQRARKVRVR